MKRNAVLLASLLAACTVGPNYVRPPVETPAAYKEAGNWKPAQPQDDANRGKWWAMYKDPQLDALMEQVSISNQNLARAEAQYRQAVALVQSARAGYYPTVTGGVSNTRSRASATTIATPTTAPVSRGVVVNHNLPFQASWAPDVWGSIRRSVEANEASAQASAGDLEAARLSAQATLAQSYYQLRVLDAQQALLEETIAAYGKSLQLVQNQYAAGIVAKADVITAQAQVKTSQAQAIDLGVQRAQLEHDIAMLVGKPASSFSIARAPLSAVPPAIPEALPSTLLERRPDIAAAERRMQQANAQIGVAEAAWFPALSLSGAAGYQSATMVDWLTAPSRFWSFGTALTQTLFNGGLRQANKDQAIAAYEANVAAYRQTVLAGFQQVEDNLAALRILEQEAEVQGEAVKLADQSLALALNQYKAGIVSIVNVVVAQAAALANQRAAADILARRMSASVQLVTALGGGWNAGELPARDQLIGGGETRPGRGPQAAGAGR
jgi:NodT family efflux transporter outer membrane factor (OMF) lipoprotein